VEDLTAGGTAEFEPNIRGVSGLLDGRRIDYDFETDQPLYPPTHYLQKENLLIIEGEYSLIHNH
jgi:hypothetical protein